MSRQTTILIAVTIWVVGVIIAIPQLLYFTTLTDTSNGHVYCLAVWPDGATNESVLEFV